MHELPDYINGNITDGELEKQIRNEIDNNPEFRSEYESMKNTFALLGTAALSEPSPFYFTNLLPNINEKIDAGAKHEGIFAGWLVNVLKFAIPALILILGYFIYTQITGSNDSTEEKMTDDRNKIIQEESPVQKDDNLFTNADDSTNTENSPGIQNNNTDWNVTFHPGTAMTTDNGGSAIAGDDLDEILTETATYPVAGEDPEIEAVQDLSTQQQDELLKYLEDAQL